MRGGRGERRTEEERETQGRGISRIAVLSLEKSWNNTIVVVVVVIATVTVTAVKN